MTNLFHRLLTINAYIWMRTRGWVLKVFLRMLGCKVGKDFRCLGWPQFRYYPKRNVFIGDHVTIGRHMVFDIAPEGKLTINDHSILSDNVYLCTITEIHFGKWSGIADNVTVRGSFHDIYAGGNFRQQPSTSMPIYFGDDSGAGTHSIILAGAQIEDGVFIAANSVVPLNARLEPYGVYAGSPVKMINKRK